MHGDTQKSFFCTKNLFAERVAKTRIAALPLQKTGGLFMTLIFDLLIFFLRKTGGFLIHSSVTDGDYEPAKNARASNRGDAQISQTFKRAKNKG